MDWNTKLQDIIDYVENHLQRDQEPIKQEEIAQLAGCSIGFFQKVFSYMYGISFAEYVRSRKLTLAGYDLKSTNLRVIDISYRYGYDSPTSFTKAFQQFHGITPTQARNIDAQLRVIPKMQIASKQRYTWSIKQKPGFRLLGKKMHYRKGEQYTKIPAFWSECQRDGTFSQLITMDQGTPQGVFGLYPYENFNSDRQNYSLMVISDDALPKGYYEISIPATTWAIFDCQGPVPQAMQNGWKYLHEEWIMKYPFQHAACPELEWYSNANAYDSNYSSQIWIPIIHKH